jgi:hypothetical protein
MKGILTAPGELAGVDAGVRSRSRNGEPSPTSKTGDRIGVASRNGLLKYGKP